jgi:hypothetical protein
MEGSFYLEAYTPNSNGRNSIKTWFSGSNFVYIDGDGAAGNAPAYGNGVNVIIRGGKSGTYSNVDSRGTAGYVTVEGGSAFSGSSTTHVAAAGVNIQTGLGLGSGSAADLTFSTSTTSSIASTYHTQTQRMIIKGQTGNIGIGTSVPSASLHISGSSNSVLFEVDSPAVNNILYVSGSGNVGIGTSNPTVALEVSGSIISKAGMLSTGSISHRGSFKLQGEPIAYGSLPYTGSWQDMIVFTPGANLGGGSYLYPQFYVTWGGSTTTITGGTLSTSSPASNVNALSLSAGGRNFSIYPYEQYISSTRNLNLLPGSSYNVGINTQSPTAKLHIVGQGTTSSTTTLLVQNANATSSLQIYDDNNITIGLGTTTFSSAGWGGGSSPSSSIYFNNAINDHETNHEIRIRASLQGNPYNRILLPTGYGGTYSFIGAGNGVVLALSNSGSGYIMNYSNTGITANSGQNVYSNNTSTRTSVFGGGTNDAHHLAPFTITLQGNKPFDNASAANGGDVYIKSGAGSTGTSGISGSVYLLGSTISLSGSVAVTGSLTVSGSIRATVPTTSSYVCDGILSSNQTFATGSDVTIAFVDYVDPNGWLTSNQFKPTIAGYYSVSFGVWLQNPGVASNQVNVQMRKNTDAMIISQQPLNNGTGISLGGSRIVQMNGTTDYLDWTVFQGTVGSGTTGTLLQGSANGSGTWFSAFLLTQ